MMKTLLKTFLVSLLLGLGIITINGQCDNGTNIFPTTAYTPTPNAWSTASGNSWAGEIIPINVRAGYEYQFSTCGTYGGMTARYDTQLSLYDNNRTNVAYNDDYSGCSTQSYIAWTATYDGVAFLHLNEYNCQSNQTATEVMIYSTPAAAPAACTTLDYIEDFESGSSGIAITAGTGVSGVIDRAGRVRR